MLFIALGTDGVYDLSLAVSDEPTSLDAASFFLDCPSGQIFLGASEKVTGGGFEPTGRRKGAIVSIAPGSYTVQISMRNASSIDFTMHPTNQAKENSFEDLISLAHESEL